MDKIKVIITNNQKEVKIPTGLRMLVRRCCNAVLRLEEFQGLTDNKRSYKSLLIRYGTIFQGLQELINQRYRPLR